MTLPHAGRAGTADPRTLVLSPRHRRTVWGDIDGLTNSVRTHGIITPLAVRPQNYPASEDGPLEIIHGARRQRASIAAKLDEVPILVLLVDAKTATEMQYAENHEREGLHPLDEADLFADLIDFGYDPKGIAKRFGVNRFHVEGRLRLRKLCGPVRAAYADGEIVDDMAETIGLLPLEDQQIAVLDAVRAGALTDPDEVRAWVRRHMMAPLAGVPWDLNDGSMPGGACARCPKNSGAQREIFQTIAGKEDMCLDVQCRAGKFDVSWERVVAEAKRRADRMLLSEIDGVEPDDLFVPRAAGAYGVVRSSGYVDALDECPHVAGKSWYDAATAAGAKPTVYLARDQEGRPRQLLKESDVGRLVKRSLKDESSELAAQDAAIDPARAAQRAKAAKLREITATLVERVMKSADRDELTAGMLAAAADALERSIMSDTSVKVVRAALDLEPGTSIASGITNHAYMVRLIAALVVAELGAARPPVPGVAMLAEICGVDLG